jgi:hypothetical protein
MVAVDTAGVGLKAGAAAIRATITSVIFAQRLMWLKAAAAGAAMIG